MSTQRLGLAQGTAIYVGAILGAGLLALPALAAEVAGPASVLAWGLLLLLCVPVAGTFAALGSRYPDGGGIATFVYKAFGRRASAVVGYWFYFAWPVGGPATAYVGGLYIADALDGGQRTAVTATALLLAAAFATNALGLRVSARIQLVLVGLLAVLLLVACLAALRDANSDNLHPFTPHGYPAVGRAASLLFFSFAGWEAVTHLSGEFRNPQKDLRRVTALTLIVIGMLYVGLALTCVLVLGPRLADTKVPLSELLTLSFGDAASAVTATLAAVLTFGSLNSYLAGTSRLGAALARDGALPAWLAKGHEVGETPRRSLAVIAGCATAVTIVAWLLGASLGDIILATSAMLLVVTVAGLVAGVRLSPVGRPIWWGAILAALAMGVVLLFSGFYLAVPIGLALAAILYTRTSGSRLRATPEPAAAGPVAEPAAAEPGQPAAQLAGGPDPDGPTDWPEPVPAVGTSAADPE
ncbi:APC family permease [Jatrophihabitans sp.]|uniref:APC family permease n=1 Tax=Jatrophihabitans sp. TaxID=1932789 RepID=UPI002CAD8DCB|nr:APC family permease [Jatrophihabitans sp.]